MSLSKRVTSGPGGEPVLTIVVRGVDDVYRFARHMELGQCEFADAGRRALRSLKRQLGSRIWDRMLHRFHTDGQPPRGAFR